MLRESGRRTADAHQTPFDKACKEKGLALKWLSNFLQLTLVLPHHQQTGQGAQRQPELIYLPVSGKSLSSAVSFLGSGLPAVTWGSLGDRTCEFCQDERPSSCSFLPNSRSLWQSPCPPPPGELPLTQWIQLVWFFLYQTNPTWPKPNMVYLKTNGLKRP